MLRASSSEMRGRTSKNVLIRQNHMRTPPSLPPFPTSLFPPPPNAPSSQGHVVSPLPTSLALHRPSAYIPARDAWPPSCRSPPAPRPAGSGQPWPCRRAARATLVGATPSALAPRPAGRGRRPRPGRPSPCFFFYCCDVLAQAASGYGPTGRELPPRVARLKTQKQETISTIAN